ncbi:hypothetical protein EP331_09755 [bacterium]|nr:MAG: hypothetical protein EP331_09755 [bacterium]
MSDKVKELDEAARKVWLFGLGTVATIEEEAAKLARDIKSKSESIKKQTEETAKKTVDEVVKKATAVQQDIQNKVDTAVEDVVNHVGIPTQKQVRELSSKIDALTQKVEALHKKFNSK